MPDKTSLPKTALPIDCALLPIKKGRLLVSPEYAVYCRVSQEEVRQVEKVLAGETKLETLSPALLKELEEHGFFNEPRPPEPYLPTVQIQLTNECNLKCNYCCTNSGTQRQKEITLSQCQRVIREVSETLGENCRVSLLGGEPLMVEWALDLAEEMCDLHLDGCLFTNGLPLTDPEKAKRCAALSRRGMEFRISLAGPTQPLCDKLSGTERYEKAILGMKTMAQFGGHAKVDLMLTPQQVDDTAKHLSRLKRDLPDSFPIALGVCYISGRENGEHVFHSASEMEEAFDLIAFEAGETILAPKPQKRYHRREGCTCALGHHLHIRSDGALFPCFKMEEKIGTLDEMDFVKAMAKNRANPHPAAGLSVCSDCALNTLCGGGCRSENILYTGDGDTPLCDDWRPLVIAEMLADDRPDALDWPLPHLAAEARRRGIAAPSELKIVRPSRHIWEETDNTV